MPKFILGQKLAMTQIYDAKGVVVPVTVMEVQPNTVLQVKSAQKDGYTAVQVGYGARKSKNVARSQRGHFRERGSFRYVREFRIDQADSPPAVGGTLDLTVFQEGERVAVIAVSKGKGFAGVVKRHHFAGGPASHGHPHNHRAPGSIGCRFPQHVHKGKRMAGHMGAGRVTVRNLEIAKVDKENRLLAVRGAIPGGRGALVQVVSLEA